ncbi:hypothetical protein JCM8547_009293 [Rhodosporidiobolus lusitaniae]
MLTRTSSSPPPILPPLLSSSRTPSACNRETTTLESLTTTLKSWAPLSPSSGTVELPTFPSSDAETDYDSHRDEFGGRGEYEGERGDGKRGWSAEDAPDAGERVGWARWDELPAERAEGPRRVLLLGYKNGGIAVWDCSSLDTWVELLNLPTLDSALAHSDSKLRKQFPRGAGTTTSAVVLPPPLLSVGQADPYSDQCPLLALSATSPSSSSSSPSSCVFLYSLRTHRIVSSFSLSGHVHRLASSRHHLVVSTTTPPALHIYSLPSLTPHPSSPITAVVRSPHGGHPVFSLGQGGRLLAYASSAPLLSSRLDRSPARPGAGILAHRGLFDSDALPTGGGEGASSGGSFTAADAAQAGGEVARRVGEGVVSGMKAIGEKGMEYWMQRGTNSGKGGGGGSGFSRSAPSASGGGGFGAQQGRRASVSALGMTKASGGGGGGGEGDLSTAGTVVVVDLLGRVSPTGENNGKSRSRSSSSSSSSTPPGKVVAHFRPYSQPLALLSLSPSSTQLLTALAAGHAFDVFELKPSVPVGVSSTSSSPSSPSSSTPSSTTPQVGKVWHRYRLPRGFTSARTSSCSWSPDGRFLAVSTLGKGTTHVYALSPSGGGAAKLEHHFGAKVKNAEELAPLSVTSGAMARVRAPKGEEGGGGRGASPGATLSKAASERNKTGGAVVPPAVVFLPKVDSLQSAFRPAPPPVSTSPPLSRFGASPSPSSAQRQQEPTFQDLLVFHAPTSPPPSFDPSSSSTSSASSASATLHRLSLLESAPPPLSTLSAAAEGTLAAASRGDVGKLLQSTSTAVSGLSQLMKRGAAPSSSSALAGGAAAAGGGKKEWTVGAMTLAGWKVGREKGWREVREKVGGEESEEENENEEEEDRKRAMGVKERGKGVRYSAFAEIETFSRSSLVLPRSIYQSQQFEFFSLPHDHTLSTKKGDFALPLRRIEVRSEVQIRQGDGAVSSDVPSSSSPVLAGQHNPFSSPSQQHLSPSSSSFEPASFDHPLKTAMQTFLDAEHLLLSPGPGSPKLPAPTFPNGVPGRHATWRDTMARTVAPAAMEGFGKVRQGLGRVRIPSVAVPSGVIAMARNRTAPILGAGGGGEGVAGAGAGAAYSSSLSFEDDDAVFAERIALDDEAEAQAASVGTACTSEVDEAAGRSRKASGEEEGAGEGDEGWGWDEEAPEPTASSSSVATPSSGALETPFEADEEFDDLEMDLPGGRGGGGMKPLSLAHPSPLSLDPIDAGSSLSVSVPAPSGLPRHLAPPVTSTSPSSSDGHSSSSFGLSASPASASGFATHAPPHLPPLPTLGTSPPILDRPGSALSGIGILAPNPSSAVGLAAPVNGVARSESPASVALSSSPSEGSPEGGGGGRKKKKGRK